MFGHIYTEEEKMFMKEYVPGHSYAEIQIAFTDKFGWNISTSQIKGYIGNHKLNTGRNGCFKKGQVAHNKGQKMPPEVYEKAKATMFQKGHVPHNHRHVGSERLSKDGYIEVKIAEPNKWRLKHNVVWEQYNGKIPKGSAVIFLDGNKQNVEINNLKLIKRSELLIMNRYDLYGADAETTEVATNLAKLIDTTNNIRRTNGKKKTFNTTRNNGTV